MRLSATGRNESCIAWIANIEIIRKGGKRELARITIIEIIRNEGKRELAWRPNIE